MAGDSDMVMVPREPTPEMVKAGALAAAEVPAMRNRDQAAAVWSAMLFSAPSITSTAEQPGEGQAPADPALALLRALVRAIPAVRRTGSASQFLGTSCRMMQAYDAARAFLAAPAGVYVASRASIPARAAMWRDYRRNGAPIISSWIDEAGEGDTADLSELWGRIGREVASAERLVLYVTPDDFPLKGALVEVGMALTAGVPVVVVAPEVDLEPRSLRPLGSWARHPLVTFASSLADALANLPSEGPNHG